MLVAFTLGNFLSVREPQTISLESVSITDYPEATFPLLDRTLLRSAVIYGANSSGKSNFLRGLSIMKRIVSTSAERSSTSTLPVTPFLLHEATEKAPSYFEVLFIVAGAQYRYGFKASEHSIHEEWLFRQYGQAKEEALFVRDEEGIAIAEVFSEGAGLEEKTRENALFVSVVDQFNGSISKLVMGWFNTLNVISGLQHERYKAVTFSLLEKENMRKQLVAFFRSLDLGFQDIVFKQEDFHAGLLPADIPVEMLQNITTDLAGKKIASIDTIHHKYNDAGEVVGKHLFKLDRQESSGTNKVVDLSGVIFHSLQNGGILVIDELDAKLHPVMTIAITGLFNSPDTNPKNAQLVFATHDTNLLSYGCFRRDQIYFIEKDRTESSRLYSLVEYKDDEGKKVRKDRSFEKDYIQGRYGAIPYIGDFQKILQNNG